MKKQEKFQAKPKGEKQERKGERSKETPRREGEKNPRQPGRKESSRKGNR